MIGILKSKGTIRVVSVLVPVVVALLILVPQKLDLPMEIVKVLPALNASLNSITTGLLVVALILIKNKKVRGHQMAMQTALIMGAIFLVSYVVYHASAPSTLFGDMDHDGIVSEAEKAEAGWMRPVYLIVLISHILLAIVVLPLVLTAFYFAWNQQFEKHKRIVKFTYPVWLYVSITGVVVFLMIKQYYPW